MPETPWAQNGNPGVTPETCGAIGERAQVVVVWVRAPGIGTRKHKGKAISYAYLMACGF